jgi:MerR family transcriptional regulator, copper efflux regulator
MESQMQIGTLAKATGASPKAIRLYEEIGLLPAVGRHGAYRVYRNEHLQLVKWIKQAQGLGFKLSELGALQSAADAPAWARIADMVDAKRERVAAELARLAAIERQLGALAQELRSCETLSPPVRYCQE